MNIRICLQSRILAEGLRALIQQLHPEWPIAVNNDPFPILDTTDLFVTDNGSCNRKWRERCRGAHFVLIDSGLHEQEVTFLLLAEHFDGVLAPEFDSSLLERALQAIASGQMWLDQKYLKGLVQHQQVSDSTHINTLTKHEQHITAFVAQGLSNREIAEKLCVCEQTIKSNLSKIYRKLNIRNRTQLVRLVIRHPIVSPA